jgi:hypothetical protein
MYKGLFILMLSLSLTACEKDNDKEPDVPAAITIVNPIAGTIFLNGTALQIRGNATDNNVLASVQCTVRNTTSNATLYSRTINTGNVGFFDFGQDWTITGITGPTPARLIITTTDKVGYTATKEVDIQLTD